MKYRLIVGKDRYDVLQEKMNDKITFIKEEVEENKENWIHFDIDIDSQFDLLDVFHAGITYGSNIMSKAFAK